MQDTAFKISTCKCVNQEAPTFFMPTACDFMRDCGSQTKQTVLEFALWREEMVPVKGPFLTLERHIPGNQTGHCSSTSHQPLTSGYTKDLKFISLLCNISRKAPRNSGWCFNLFFEPDCLALSYLLQSLIS